MNDSSDALALIATSQKVSLAQAKLRGLYDKLYKLAVITREEDQQLNDAGLRAKMLSSPEERCMKAGIKIVSVA